MTVRRSSLVAPLTTLTVALMACGKSGSSGGSTGDSGTSGSNATTGASGSTGNGGTTGCEATQYELSSSHFDLPDLAVATGKPFGRLAGSTSCTKGTTALYSSLDIDGDGKFDLVVTDDCTDTCVGTSYWNTFSGTCES